MMLMPSCFSAVCRPRKARPRSRARGLEKREIVRPERRPRRFQLLALHELRNSAHVFLWSVSVEIGNWGQTYRGCYQ